MPPKTKRILYALLLLVIPVVLFANIPLKHHPVSNYTPVALKADAQPITICSGASIVIQGEPTIITPDSYSWEVLQSGNWIQAPGINNGANYQPSLLINNTGSDIVYNIRRKIVIGASSGYDSYYDVTVQPSSPITNNTVTAPTVTSFCSTANPGTITGSTPNGGNGTYAYQWQSSTDNSTFNNIAGATGKDYTPPQLTATTYYRRAVNAGSCVVAAPSNAVAFVVLTPVSNNTISAPAVTGFCSSGDAAVITGNTPSGGNGTFLYQWQSSTDNVTFTDIAGATSRDYDPQLLTATTFFRRMTTSGSCTTPVPSNVVTISIEPPVASNSINTPAVTSYCGTANPPAIVGSTPTGSNGVYSYQWQVSPDNSNFSNIAGATGKDYTPPQLTVTTYYRRTLTAGSCVVAAPSNSVAFVVIPAVTNNVITAPAITSFCTSGDAAVITGTTPTGGNGTYAYQWQSSTDNVNFTDIGGATSRDYDPAATAVTTYYRRSITSGSCTTPLISGVVTITVTPAITNNTATPPPVTNFCTTANPSTIIGSTPTGGSGTYTYQWQSSTDNSTFNNIAGATGKDYTPPQLTATTYYRRTVNAGSCVVAAPSNAVAFVVLTPVSNNTVSAPAVTGFCSSGDAAVITGNTPGGGDGTFLYQWQSSTDNVTFTDIAGATSRDYDPQLLTATTYFRRMTTSGSCNTPVPSNVVTVNAIPAVTNNVITTPAITSFCTSGDAAVITGTTPTGGNGTYAYQWQSSTDNVNFTDIGGATSRDYDPAATTVTTYYRRSITSGSCTTPMISGVVAITVTPVIANNTVTLPAVTNFCTGGDPDVITGNTPNGGNGIFTYQWQISTDNVNFTDIIGATSRDYDPAAVTVTTYYRRLATSGSCTTPVFSNVVTINVIPAIANNAVTAPAITSFCTSGNAAVIIGTTPTGGNGTYAYQWQSSTDNVNFTDITGATSKDYDPPVTSTTTYYRRSVTSGSCAVPLISGVVTITVTPAIANNTVTPPAVTSFCTTANPAAIIGSTPSGGSGSYTYQWQSSTDNVTFTNIAGATGKDYTPPQLTATTYYRRTVNAGSCVVAAPSNAVAFVVLTPVSNNTVSAPAVTGFCSSGDAAVITGNTPGGGDGTFLYQWQSSTDNVTFTDIAGATSRDYDPQLLTATTYFRRMTTSGSCTTPVPSNVVSISVESVIANNVVVPPLVTIFCASGDAAVITGTPPSGGNGTYAYQWQSSTDNINFTNIAGATSRDYDPPVASTTIYYRRSITSGTCTTPVPSNVVTINVTPAITNYLVTAPATTSYCTSGDPAVITGSTPTGGNGTYAYQWQSSTDNVNFTDISGATSRDYDPPLTSTTIYYRRSTTSGTCSTPVSSNVVVILVTPAITSNTIITPAVNSFCTTGDAAVITGITATGGDGTYAYQWQRSTDNITFTNIAGATLRDYDPPVANATVYYRRMVASGQCTVPVVSNVVVVNVLPQPITPVLSVLPTITICPGNTASLSVNAQPGITYNWYDSPARNNLLFSGNTYVTPALTSNRTYYVEGTNGTCASTSLATVQVNVAAEPSVPAVANNPTVCAGSAATLSVLTPQAGLTYRWYAASSGGTALATGTTFNTGALTANAIYYLEALNVSGCTSPSRTAVTVTVAPLPQVTVRGAAVCPGTSASLQATANVPNATINWYTGANGGTPVFTGDTYTTPQLNANTNYYVEVINNVTSCASGRQLVSVQILQPLPAPAVTVGKVTANSVTFNWGEVNGAKGYQVSVDNGQTFINPNSGTTGLSHTITGLQLNQTVSISVRAIGNTDCEQSASALATGQTKIENAEDEVYVPNAFTPNGDGRNDQVHVHGAYIQSFSFYVYSQWGEILFTTTDASKGWDGTYKNTQEPAGVYIYVLKATLINGQQINKKGTITLIR